MKKFLPYLLIPLAFLSGATFVKIQNLRGAPVQSVIMTDLNGNGLQVKLGTSLVVTNGTLDVVAIPNGFPAIYVTKITSTTQNSFPIPAGRSVCDVSRNIPQSPNEDYSIVNGIIIFNTQPLIDDVVKLVCW